MTLFSVKHGAQAPAAPALSTEAPARQAAVRRAPAALAAPGAAGAPAPPALRRDASREGADRPGRGAERNEIYRSAV